jgi:hypothetical protein
MENQMIPKSFIAIPALLIALCAAPAFALDINIGGSASDDASGSIGDGGLSAGADSSASTSVSSEQSSGDGDANGSASVNANGKAEAAAPNGEASANALASPAGSGSSSAVVEVNGPLNDVIQLIRGSNWSEASFSGFGSIDAAAYDIDAWLDSENSAEFDLTLEAKAEDIAELQHSIAANADFSAWLDFENVDASSVVAVGVTGDGSLAVFTHD